MAPGHYLRLLAIDLPENQRGIEVWRVQDRAISPLFEVIRTRGSETPEVLVRQVDGSYRRG